MYQNIQFKIHFLPLKKVRFLPLVSDESETEIYSTGTRSRHADVEEDPSDGDYILLDESESEMSEVGESEIARWNPLWKEVRTAMVIEAPINIEIRFCNFNLILKRNNFEMFILENVLGQTSIMFSSMRSMQVSFILISFLII